MHTRILIQTTGSSSQIGIRMGHQAGQLRPTCISKRWVKWRHALMPTSDQGTECSFQVRGPPEAALQSFLERGGCVDVKIMSQKVGFGENVWEWGSDNFDTDACEVSHENQSCMHPVRIAGPHATAFKQVLREEACTL